MPLIMDPIGDLLTRMRNAQAARKHSCSAPWSKIKEELCHLLQKEGWLKKVEVSGEGVEKSIDVWFHNDKPRLNLKRESRPGRRVYSKSEELRPVLNGFGIAILTTSQGLMTDIKAREKKIGGEVLCTIS